MKMMLPEMAAGFI